MDAFGKQPFLVVCLFYFVAAATGYGGIRLNAASNFTVEVAKDGSYVLYIDNAPWLRSAATYFTVQNNTYSTADGSLELLNQNTLTGDDDIGQWKAITFTWNAGGFVINTGFRAYRDVAAVVFEQEFPYGLQGTKTSRNITSSAFPNFKIDGDIVDLGYLAYGGMFTGDMAKWVGRWRFPDFGITGGLDGGPILLYNRQSDALIISPFSQFMVASPRHDVVNNWYGWGIAGSVKSYPAPFKYETIVYYSPNGVREAVSQWGNSMRKYYKKDTSTRDTDFTNNYLSYWTDNGAYYVNYYVPSYTIGNLTYQEALLGTKAYAESLGIPYRTYQYSVWYEITGGFGYGGTLLWEPNTKMIPKGMGYLRDQLVTQSTAHNRWWAAKTPYAKQNGGKYNFVMDATYALPQDLQFWIDIFAQSQNWGIKNYMQDWLNAYIEKTDIAIEDVYTARNWLMQMGQGASMNDVTIQYCMSLGRHILQSLEIPSVTQTRASNDYQPNHDVYEQWRIGQTNLLAHAVGLAPFKDCFWTTGDQPGNFYKAQEKYPELQALVATLTAGPVGPADMIGRTNVSLLMRCCRNDGLILKPSRPAFMVDAQLQQSSFGGSIGPDGEVWTTYSDVDDYRFGVIFASAMKNTYRVGPTAAAFGPKLANSRVFGYLDPTTGNLPEFSEDNPVIITSGCSRSDLCLFYVTPVLTLRNAELLLLGERAKWIPMSAQRFTRIQYTGNDVRIDVTGAPDEKVTFYYILGNEPLSVTCQLPQSGLAFIRIEQRQCYGR